MRRIEFKALVTECEGWIENKMARFPTDSHREQFEKKFMEKCEKNSEENSAEN